MTDPAEQFGAELYRLLQVSHEFLPELTDIYSEVSHDVATARGLLENVLTRPAYFGAAPYGPLHQPWLTLEAQVTKILADMVTEFDDTARALDLAIADYKAVDSGAAAALQNLIRQDGDPNPGMVSR